MGGRKTSYRGAETCQPHARQRTRMQDARRALRARRWREPAQLGNGRKARTGVSPARGRPATRSALGEPEGNQARSHPAARRQSAGARRATPVPVGTLLAAPSDGLGGSFRSEPGASSGAQDVSPGRAYPTETETAPRATRTRALGTALLSPLQTRKVPRTPSTLRTLPPVTGWGSRRKGQGPE